MSPLPSRLPSSEADADAHAPAVLDALGRPHRSLRVSLTDRCNLRCEYCMPEEEYAWLERGHLLQVEEYATLVGLFARTGVTEVHLTGGEPLLHPEVARLVSLLTANTQLEDVALTTNGVLLAAQAQTLRAAGLHRVTVSLDTLKRERFLSGTRRDVLPRVLEGLEVASKQGFSALKLNAVIIRGWNDDELVPLLEYGKRLGAEVRFIEYMDVGGATRWSRTQVLSKEALLAQLGAHYGAVMPMPDGGGSSPAARYRLPDGTTFGVIASTTAPFCRTCDRSRLSADGMWFRCLYASVGMPLGRMLREGVSLETLETRIRDTWRTRTDRGAEERLGLPLRGAFASPEELRTKPHLEMHTRGG